MSLLSQESVDQENPVIIWEPIPNASSYQLQIKNDSDEIIDELIDLMGENIIEYK